MPVVRCQVFRGFCNSGSPRFQVLRSLNESIAANMALAALGRWTANDPERKAVAQGSQTVLMHTVCRFYLNKRKNLILHLK
jgi:hypothetical protein